MFKCLLGSVGRGIIYNDDFQSYIDGVVDEGATLGTVDGDSVGGTLGPAEGVVVGTREGDSDG